MRMEREVIMEECIVKLYEITASQSNYLEKNEVEEFINLLDERQVIIEKVLNVKNEKGFSKDEIQLIKKVQEMDSRNQEKYIELFEEVKAKLKQVRKMKENEMKFIQDYAKYSEIGTFGARK